MKIKRTANAGVLLELDGARILLDGVCGEVKPYLPTPEALRQELANSRLDAVAFTHAHEDHYDAAFVSEYLQSAAGPILGPADIPFSSQKTVDIGKVRVIQVPTHHIGKLPAMGHNSFIVQGTRCVWFVGDASPLRWGKFTDLPKPDVLIAPYAYAIASGWQVSGRLGAKSVILLHLPLRDADPYGLWEAVEATTGQGGGPELYIPQMGETIDLM